LAEKIPFNIFLSSAGNSIELVLPTHGVLKKNLIRKNIRFKSKGNLDIIKNSLVVSILLFVVAVMHIAGGLYDIFIKDLLPVHESFLGMTS